MSTLLVAFALVDVILLVGVLLIYLNWVAGLLQKIDNGLATTVDLVVQIVGHAEPIIPGLQQINRTLGIISGALPLLYRLAERIEAVSQGRVAIGSNTAGTASGTGNYTGAAGIVILGIRHSQEGSDADGMRRRCGDRLFVPDAGSLSWFAFVGGVTRVSRWGRVRTSLDGARTSTRGR